MHFRSTRDDAGPMQRHSQAQAPQIARKTRSPQIDAMTTRELSVVSRLLVPSSLTKVSACPEASLVKPDDSVSSISREPCKSAAQCRTFPRCAGTKRAPSNSPSNSKRATLCATQRIISLAYARHVRVTRSSASRTCHCTRMNCQYCPQGSVYLSS